MPTQEAAGSVQLLNDEKRQETEVYLEKKALSKSNTRNQGKKQGRKADDLTLKQGNTQTHKELINS